MAAALLGGEFARLSPIVACTCALWALGTVDDRRGLAAWPRVAAECVAAIVLWSTGLGWDVFPGGAADLALTIVWVVGLVNAFNLIDNMDGAAATLAAVTSVAIGVLALIEGDVPLAILMFGLAGACLGFLPYNLASPARIFLGDGGSLPIGFVVAAALMALPMAPELGLEHVLVAVLLAGVPVLDTTLVTVSRRRAGISLLTADATTSPTGSSPAWRRAHRRAHAGRGAGGLARSRSVWCSSARLRAGSMVDLVRGRAAAIVLLESRSWAPERESSPHAEPATWSSLRRAQPPAPQPGPVARRGGPDRLHRGLLRPQPLPLRLLRRLGLGADRARAARRAARPADRSARGATPGRAGRGGALARLWLWALISTGWAESADQAMTEANRWLLYAALFGVLVLLLATTARDGGRWRRGGGDPGARRLPRVRMLAGSGDELFLGGRLNEPLGYINGQAGYLLLGVWPLIALAERARSP